MMDRRWTLDDGPSPDYKHTGELKIFHETFFLLFIKPHTQSTLDRISSTVLQFYLSHSLTLVLLNKLRCYATSNFQLIRILDPSYSYKFKYLMTNSTDPDQLAS